MVGYGNCRLGLWLAKGAVASIINSFLVIRASISCIHGYTSCLCFIAIAEMLGQCLFLSVTIFLA
jgi:hypothetical protein